MVYHTIVKGIARKNFELVNAKKHSEIFAGCHDNIHHRFGGHHALGGERTGKEVLGLWFARLGRLAPGLELTVRDIWVKGWPWDTTLIIRWDATDRFLDGSGTYRNHGVHVVRLKWGKAVDIDANEDSQAVYDNMEIQKRCGVEEAGLPPLTNEWAASQRLLNGAQKGFPYERMKSR